MGMSPTRPRLVPGEGPSTIEDRKGVIVMPETDSSARMHGGPSTWIDKLQQSLSNGFEDERQEAVWNKASTSALYLTTSAIFVADLVFISIDYNRYGSASFVFLLIALGGLLYAQLTARRQNVRPVVRAPSWRSTAVSSVLFGALFFVITRAMDHGGDWRTRLILCAVVAMVWGTLMRAALKSNMIGRRESGTTCPKAGDPR